MIPAGVTLNGAKRQLEIDKNYEKSGIAYISKEETIPPFSEKFISVNLRYNNKYRDQVDNKPIMMNIYEPLMIRKGVSISPGLQYGQSASESLSDQVVKIVITNFTDTEVRLPDQTIIASTEIYDESDIVLNQLNSRSLVSQFNSMVSEKRHVHT